MNSPASATAALAVCESSEKAIAAVVNDCKQNACVAAFQRRRGQPSVEEAKPALYKASKPQ